MKYDDFNQLFGLDFMITDDFHPLLIEVNMNPCLETSCNLLNRLIPALVEQTLRVAVDPLFPPPNEWPKSKKYMISEVIFAACKFKVVFDNESHCLELEDLEGYYSAGEQDEWGQYDEN